MIYKEIKDITSREGVIWKSPPNGWIKANFGGSTKGNPGRVGCGGVLRDHNFRVVDVVVFSIGISTSHREEVFMALFTVRKVGEMGIRKLWLEGNSLNIVNMINNNYSVTWNIEMIIEEIKSLLNNFEKFIITHI